MSSAQTEMRVLTSLAYRLYTMKIGTSR